MRIIAIVMGLASGVSSAAPLPSGDDLELLYQPPPLGLGLPFNDVAAACTFTLDISPAGATANICGVCKASESADPAIAEIYEERALEGITEYISQFIFEPSNEWHTRVLTIDVTAPYNAVPVPGAPEPITCAALTS